MTAPVPAPDRDHTAECYANGCTTGSHPAPRPGHVTGGPWTPEEAATITALGEHVVYPCTCGVVPGIHKHIRSRHFAGGTR